MKKVIIVVGKHGRKSTKLLFSKLDKENATHILKSNRLDAFVYRKDKQNLKKRFIDRTLQTPDCTNSIVFRWGWYGEIETNKSSIVYNKAESIKLSNSKGNARKFLQSKGVDVPKTYLLDEVDELLANDGFNYPIIARPEHHGQGRELYVCENSGEIKEAIRKGATYFSEFYPKTEEYGVHCFMGKVLAVVRKPEPDDRNQVAWNRAQNDKPFEVVPFSDYKNYICKLALKAVKELGLDYGRVDIMVQNDNKALPRAVVCEVNTAPTLNSTNYVLERWTKGFNKLANSETRVEHWDFEQFEKASSLAWKDNQF